MDLPGENPLIRKCLRLEQNDAIFGPSIRVFRLNYLAEENDITTRELGKILGIDHSVAARILKGERAITIEHAKSLGTRFKMDPKAFLKL
jgi:antitoxin component HigA of HigAB toxin-antitoxin module